jgi:DNA uptake protein ComE-like DNA-binding protein
VRAGRRLWLWFSAFEARKVALVGVALLAWAATPYRAAAVPTRVVQIPGLGWVDADDTPGVPIAARDGDRLVWRLAAAAAPRAAELEEAAGTAESADANADLVALEAVFADPSAAHENAGDPRAFGGRVSINHGSAADLESLPGVGPALAERITAGRPYRSVHDLDRVRGIGPKTLAKLSPLVEL